MNTEKFLDILKDCREDMHEPDEQGIKATIIGTELDNAMGDTFYPEMILSGNHEMLIKIENENNGRFGLFNLATILAYTRKAIEAGISI